MDLSNTAIFSCACQGTRQDLHPLALTARLNLQLHLRCHPSIDSDHLPVPCRVSKPGIPCPEFHSMTTQTKTTNWLSSANNPQRQLEGQPPLELADSKQLGGAARNLTSAAVEELQRSTTIGRRPAALPKNINQQAGVPLLRDHARELHWGFLKSPKAAPPRRQDLAGYDTTALAERSRAIKMAPEPFCNDLNFSRQTPQTPPPAVPPRPHHPLQAPPLPPAYATSRLETGQEASPLRRSANTATATRESPAACMLTQLHQPRPGARLLTKHRIPAPPASAPQPEASVCAPVCAPPPTTTTTKPNPNKSFPHQILSHKGTPTPSLSCNWQVQNSCQSHNQKCLIKKLYPGRQVSAQPPNGADCRHGGEPSQAPPPWRQRRLHPRRSQLPAPPPGSQPPAPPPEEQPPLLHLRGPDHHRGSTTGAPDRLHPQSPQTPHHPAGGPPSAAPGRRDKDPRPRHK